MATGNGELEDFWEFTKERSQQLIDAMNDDFRERYSEHYALYSSFTQKLKDRDERIQMQGEAVIKKEKQIRELESRVRVLEAQLDIYKGKRHGD
jgi:uncharacterized protein (DUF3084 family)